MAKKVQTLVEVYDDLDGEVIDSGLEQTVEFSYGGVDYRMDLRPSNAEAFDELMKPYIDAAERVTASRPVKRATSTGTRAASGSGRSKEELQAVRDWAAKNGHEVAPRGRIKSEVLEAYDAAHAS